MEEAPTWVGFRLRLGLRLGFANPNPHPHPHPNPNPMAQTLTLTLTLTLTHHDIGRLLEALEDVLLHVRHAVLGADGLDLVGRGLGLGLG